jgi:hypothetical protein
LESGFRDAGLDGRAVGQVVLTGMEGGRGVAGMPPSGAGGDYLPQTSVSM